jgi:hypothetical protein
MATETYDHYVEELDMEVQLELEISFENDGIGSYEYWGSREYDAGTNYHEVTGLEYDTSKYTEEQNRIIEASIEANRKEIEENAIKRYEKGLEF